jgi:hypothetical protein
MYRFVEYKRKKKKLTYRNHGGIGQELLRPSLLAGRLCIQVSAPDFLNQDARQLSETEQYEHLVRLC